MQEVFQPIHQEDRLVMTVAILLAIAGAIGLVLKLRQKAVGDARNRNLLVAMLLFFLTIISAGTAFFSWFSMYKTGPVILSSDAVETPYGRVAFRDIRQAEIIVDQPVSLFPGQSGSRAVKLLVIEESSGKAHVLSEKNYEIQRILGALREAQKSNI